MGLRRKIEDLAIGGYQSMDEFIRQIYESDRPRSVHLITVNPEIVWHSINCRRYSEVFKAAEIRVPDGIGVVIPMKLSGLEATRLPGYEIFLKLMEKAGQRGHTVFLVGGSSTVNRAVKIKLVEELSVDVVGAMDGFSGSEDEELVVRNIEETKPDIVIVAMGAPRQDFLIDKIRKSYSRPLFIGVGGSFDVYSGTVPRAPRILQRFWLEWFYRLLKNPSRLPRYVSIAKYVVWLVRPGNR